MWYFIGKFRINYNGLNLLQGQENFKLLNAKQENIRNNGPISRDKNVQINYIAEFNNIKV